MNIRNRNKIMSFLLILVSLIAISIIFLAIALEIYWAFVLHTIVMGIAFILAIADPYKNLIVNENQYIYPRKALISQFFFVGGIILVISFSYFLIFIFIFIPDEDIQLVIANILLIPIITGVVLNIIGLYMVIYKDAWERKKDKV